MILRQTLFILGAAASLPFGFPLGRQLLFQICDGVTERRKLFRRLLECGYSETVLDAFAQDLSLSQQSSVDAFLETRPAYVELGKAAIAASLIPYEDDKRLSRQQNSRTWFEYLFNEMRVASSKDFNANRIAFVTFNYDRSLERLFFLALRSSYDLPDERALELTRDIPIHHPHGSLGPFSLDQDHGRTYDPSITPEAIRAAAESIRVLHEAERHGDNFKPVADLRDAADVIIVLGFGYHPDTLIRIGVQAIRARQAIYGSVYDLTAAEVQRIKRQLPSHAQFGEPQEDTLLFLRKTHGIVLATSRS